MNTNRLLSVALLCAVATGCGTGTAPSAPAGEAGAATPPASAAAAATQPSPTAGTKAAMPITANAKIGADGSLKLEAGDIALALSAQGCSEQTQSLTLCNEQVALTLRKSDGSFEQTLDPAAVYIKSDATLYRGPLDASYKQGGHSFVLTDLNGDGHEDLLVWSGLEGAYGGPSFDVYLFDATKRAFAFDQDFSDLTIGANGLFSVEAGKIKVTSSDGCCLHVFDTYALEAGKPVLVERVTEDTTEGEDKPKTKTEKRVDGQLKEVPATP